MQNPQDLEVTDDAEPERSCTALPPRLLLLYRGTQVLNPPTEHPLATGTTVLGRAPAESQGICVDDRRCSRVHAVLQHDARSAQLRIADAGSRNGTSVNGTAIKQMQLHNGDLIRIGDSLLLVRHGHKQESSAPLGELLGVSAAASGLRDTLWRIAKSPATVLLLGESGTGKEVAARYLHTHSNRRGPFVPVNCGALPESLIESQLFGHAKGAFTGASAHPGFFRAADTGTLFLDEIGELPLTAQPKLLRILEDHTVFPVGAVSGQRVDVRLIVATNRNLLQSVSEGKFRGDLYARIAELSVTLPALSDRPEDILLLLQHFCTTQPQILSPALAEALLLYEWPFNIREVRKLASELGTLGADQAVLATRLRPKRIAMAAVEEEDMPPRAQLEELLRAQHGNVAAVARVLSRPRKNVYRWIEQYALSLGAFRD